MLTDCCALPSGSSPLHTPGAGSCWGLPFLPGRSRASPGKDTGGLCPSTSNAPAAQPASATLFSFLDESPSVTCVGL